MNSCALPPVPQHTSVAPSQDPQTALTEEGKSGAWFAGKNAQYDGRHVNELPPYLRGIVGVQ